jgi:predicted nucleic acid-binding protein
MLLDTSGLLALYDRRATFHTEAARLFRGAPRLVTHNYVLAEFIPLVHARRMPLPGALDYLNDLLAHPRIELRWVDDLLHVAAMGLLQRRLDKTYSLCDAVSFLVMRERGLMEALTTDRHFEQEGLVRLLQ